MTTKLEQGRLLVLRGPMGSGKTTTARSLSRKPPYWFVHLRSDAPPAHFQQEDLEERRRLQLAMWGQWTRALLEEGQNTILDCDLQLPTEMGALAQGAGTPWPGDRLILIRLSASVEEAIRRLPAKAPEEIAGFHLTWGAKTIPGEIQVDTDGLDPEKVAARIETILAERWVAL
jgi:predicted kinase